MNKNLVSVIMPVFNTESYIEANIASILAQTYTNFEFIILNDGSTDNTASIIKNIKDRRIIFKDSKKNKGNFFRRNQGCRLASGKYICVMDSDDIALQNRIERQVDIMEKDTSLVACGTFFKFIGDLGHYFVKPKSYEFIKLSLLRNSVILHPSLMINRQIFQELNYYNEEYYFASDYNLACDLALKGNVINIPEELIKYRAHKQQISQSKYLQQTEYANVIRINYLKNLGFDLSCEHEKAFTLLMGDIGFTEIEIPGIILVSDELKRQNNLNKIFPNCQFDRFIDLMVSRSYLKVHNLPDIG